MSDIIRDLPRELPNNEVMGRQLFLKLTKLFPHIEVDSSKDHEDINWSVYTLRIPKEKLAMTDSPGSIQVSLSDVDEKYVYLTISLEDQDYNNSTLPLDTKEVYDNIRTGIKDE